MEKIETYIKTHIDPVLEKPIFSGTPHILIGLSGGPDSVFLLHFLKHLELKNLISLSAAHLNHGWRPEADEEERFCKTICKNLSIPCYTEHAKNISVTHKGSKEALGRALRRHFFKAVQKQINADYIALAHHLQDQEETFFIRLIRGTSLSGLTAIKPVHGSYIRPLLSTAKQEILDYLSLHQIEYRTDVSNESDLFLRNRIRKYVLPALRATDPRFGQKFISTLETLREENELLETVTNEAYASLFTPQLVGDKKVFVTISPILQKRLIIKWICDNKVPFHPSTGFLKEIITFISSPRGGTHTLNQSWAIKKVQNKFWITGQP